MTGEITGEAAVITSATGKIGAATTRSLTGKGARVVLGDTDKQRLTIPADELRAYAVTSVVDIKTEDRIASLIQAGVTAFGRLDALHINPVAAVGPGSSDSGGYRRHFRFESALMTTMWSARHEAQTTPGSGGGSIVNVFQRSCGGTTTGSTHEAREKSRETASLYTGARYRAEGIHRNIVRSGPARSGRWRWIVSSRKYSTRIPVAGLPSTPVDFARGAAFLASPLRDTSTALSPTSTESAAN